MKRRQIFRAGLIWVALEIPLVALAAMPAETNELPQLRPPHPEIPPTLWEQHGGKLSLASLALLGAAALVAWRITRPRPPVIVPPELQARRDLASLRTVPEDGAALSRVSQILRHYFIAAFALPPGEFNTTEFCRVITSHKDIGSELAKAASDFLHECDERKFAPTSPPSPTPGAATQALSLVELAEARRAQLRAAAAKTAA